MKKISEKIKKEVVEDFLKNELSIKEIAKKNNIGRTSVCRIIKKYDKNISIIERKMKNTQEKYAKIVKEVKENKEDEEICKKNNICQATLNVIKKKFGLNSIEKKIEKTKKTNLKRYGCENPLQNKEIKEKQEKTILKKYGVKNISQNKKIKEKKKIKSLEKYGVDSVLKAKEVKEKIQKTNYEKYGYKTPLQNEEVKEKIKQTCLKKYGVKNPLQSKEIQEKIKQTNIEKYGYENALKNKKIQAKVEKTNKEKYGCKAPAQNKEIRKKMEKTCLERYGVKHALQLEKFKNKANKTNKERYGVESYAQTKEYQEKTKETNREKYGVEWTCQIKKVRLKGNDSKPNLDFTEKLKKNNIEYEREFAVKNMSYDFKVGDILVEINPYATHNSTWGLFNNPKAKDYHYKKSKTAEENGFHCIHVWDWDNQDKIINLFLKSKDKIYARECEIKEVEVKEANNFIAKNHLQENCRGNKTNIGLYHKEELVEIMVLGSPRYNKNYEYEILRLCSSKSVIGGSEKIWKYFIKKYKPKSIISYCDYSKFSGEVYKKLGFEKGKEYRPSKHWYNPKTNRHITDNLLRQRGYDQLFNASYGKGTNNEELMLKDGFVEIYDAGQQKWVWKKM